MPQTFLAKSELSAEKLRRGLTERQLTMIAIGGAIGVGLFLGSSLTIQLAGPAVIVSYLIGAVIAGIVAYCLAEMAVVQPLSGSFGIYAETYVSRWAGFCVRVTYGLVQIIAIGAEVTAVGIYFAFWFPHVSAWIWIAGVSLGLVVVNSLQVANFGEFEYWFAAIKVLAIAAFIVIGFALIAGLGHGAAFGVRNLFAFGGFFPHGFHGVWLALTLVVTSYMGVEVVAVTAGEATDPETSVPRAMRAILLRLLLFYGLAISIMLCLTPWNTLSGGGINGSPFVKAFASVGIPFSATIMNAVVITAALSSANTNLYLSTRMLYSLAHGRYAPEWLGRIGADGIPRYALAVSASGMIVAILLAVFAPGNAFLLLYGTAVTGMFFVWIVILLTHLEFRKSIPTETLATLPLKLSFHPWTTLSGIVALLAISITTLWVDGLRYSVPVFAIFLALESLLYFRLQKKLV